MKFFSKIGVIFILVIAFCAFPFSTVAKKATPSTYDAFGTSALGPGVPSVTANYYKIEKLISTKSEDKQFSMTVSVNGESIPLVLTFPTLGGFRLHTDQKGYFEPSSLEQIKYTTNAGNTTMTAKDGTKVVFNKSASLFYLDVYNKNNKKLFRLSSDQIDFGYQSSGLKKVALSMPLAKNEVLYGSGERFNELDQVGKRLVMWNVDTGYHGNSINAELWRGYKNVPILYSTRGYTLFFSSYYNAYVDIGYTDANKYSMDFDGPKFDIYFWTGTPEENLTSYTGLTGTSLLLPKWAYQYSAGAGSGVWNTYGGSIYGTAVTAMEKYAELGTPNIAAVYVEGIGSNNANVYNVFKKTGTKLLKWNAPDMNLEDMQYSMPGVSINDLPRVKQLKSPSQDSGNFIDFTSSDSKTLLENYLSNEISWGMRGGLLDFGELIQKNTLFRGNGLNGEEMHNYFSYWYAKRYNEALASTLKSNDFVFFARSASAGAQKYTALFSGDQQASFEGLRQQLVAGQSVGASGFSQWGGDLAGYAGTPTNEVFVRGMQFSAFQPLMRSHGTESRFPWDYGSVGTSTYQTHYWLRENLLNKIYSSSIISNKTGLPLMKPLVMAYPQESSLSSVYSSYMFCDDFLVAPTLTEGAYTSDVVFPRGTWYSLWNGSSVKGGGTKTVESPIDKSPVYIKAGSVIPVTLSENLVITDSMLNTKKVESLIVTIPDSNRESVYWKDEKTSVTYKNLIQSSDTFRVSAGKGNDAQALILNGISAAQIKVDGKALTRLTDVPKIGGNPGYYIESATKTIVYLGSNNWSNIDVTLGKVNVNNVLLNATVNNPDASAVLDSDFNNTFRFSSRVSSNDIVIQLDSVKKLDKISLKWTNDFASSYAVSISENNSDWQNIVERENAFGGIDEIDLEEKPVKYIKISSVESDSSKSGARLYAVEAFEKILSVSKTEESLTDNKEEEPNPSDSSPSSENDVTNSTISTNNQTDTNETEPLISKVVYIDEYYFPVTAIVLIAVGVLIAGAVVMIIVIKKKKSAANKAIDQQENEE